MITSLVIAAAAVAGIAAGVRLFRGPTLADRVIALDVALIALMCGVAAHAAARNDPGALDLIVVIAIVGFTATVAASRSVEHRGRR